MSSDEKNTLFINESFDKKDILIYVQHDFWGFFVFYRKTENCKQITTVRALFIATNQRMKMAKQTQRNVVLHAQRTSVAVMEHGLYGLLGVIIR